MLEIQSQLLLVLCAARYGVLLWLLLIARVLEVCVHWKCGCEVWDGEQWRGILPGVSISQALFLIEDLLQTLSSAREKREIQTGKELGRWCPWLQGYGFGLDEVQCSPCTS